MHYYQHNIGEFAAKTRFMSPEEIGIYVILKDEYFANGMRLACDRIANVMPPECEPALRRVLKRFFVEEDGFYVCADFEEELASYKDKGTINSENAKKRWAKRRAKAETEEKACEQDASECDSHATRTTSHANECLTNNHKPITNNQEPDREESANALPAQASASAPKAPRRKASSACPFLPGAEIPDDYREVAEKAGIGDPQKVFEKFVNHALSTDRRLVDWKAGFRTWCANETQYHPNQKPQPRPMSELTAADFMF